MWGKLEWLISFWQCLCEGLSSFNQNDSVTHIHGLAVYVKEDLPFARDLSLEKSAASYLRFWLALPHSVSCFFPPLSITLCTVFDAILSKIEEVLWISPSANVFVFGDFNICHKDELTYSGETDRWLLRCLTFLFGSLTVTLTILLFWIYLFLLTVVFVLQWISLRWEILIMLLSQFPLTFHELKTGYPVSLYRLWLFSCWLGQSLWSFERCFMGGYL